MPRLNKLIELLETGRPAFGCLLQVGDLAAARRVGESDLDFVMVDFEHEGFDFPSLGDTLQWLISRRQMAREGSTRPSPTPVVRVPVNAGERNQWVIKQTLDYGAFGLFVPHVESGDDVRSLVGSARYSRGPNGSGPEGHRGVWNKMAPRYWGCETFAEYFEQADLWPLNPEGEMILIAIVESRAGFDNIEEIVQVPGLGAVLFGTGDGSISLGDPTFDLENPALVAARKKVARACAEADVAVAFGTSDPEYIHALTKEGFRFFIGLEETRPLPATPEPS